jgi:membrane-associated phospholipid phosphatase
VSALIPDVRALALTDAVDSQRDRILDVTRFVNHHPALAHQEFECSRHIAGALATERSAPSTHAATATAAGAGVGAALALASLRESFAGTLVVLGCPADELVSPLAIRRGSGKALALALALALEGGGWAGVDYALHAHPESLTGVEALALTADRLTRSTAA